MMNRWEKCRWVVLTACLMLTGPTADRGPCWAGDWPEILGPTRNAIASPDERLLDSWPATGPETIWERPVGEGYAGVAVTQGKLYLFHRQDDQEVIEQLDSKSGKTTWRRGFPTDYASTIAPDSGPRCVPVCHADMVFVFGAQGRLTCLSQADGDVRWTHDVRKEFSVPDGYFGCGSTPIVIGDKLVVNVGGKKAGVVAFDLKSGKVAWQVTDDDASYSSPVAGPYNDSTIAYVLARLQLLGVEPQTGKILFRSPFGMRGPTVNAANPVVVGDSVLLTASYGIGAVKLKTGSEGVTEVWRLEEGLSSQYTTPVVSAGVIYAIDGRQDAGESHLRAIDWESGKQLWTREAFGYATLIYADGKLVILTTAGELVLVEARSDKYHELSRATVASGTTRALPALSDGNFYLRDDTTLKCLRLGKTSSQ